MKLAAYFLYYLAGIGWFCGYSSAVKDYPTRVPAVKDPEVVQIVLWPVYASAVASRSLAIHSFQP